MTRSFSRVVLGGTLVLVLGLTSTMYAQQQRTAAPATRAQVDNLLKKHPELSTGFKTSDGYDVKLVRQVAGGIVMRYDGSDVRGTVTIKGPIKVLEQQAGGGGWMQVAKDAARRLAKDLVDQALSDDTPQGGSARPPKIKCTQTTTYHTDGSVTMTTTCVPV